MKVITAFVCLLLSFSCLGQNMHLIERSLLRKYQRIGYWKRATFTGYEGYKTDSIEKANNDFESALSRVANTYAQSIDYNFHLLKDSGITIVTSAEGLFRIYSWDTEEGGTMHIFASLFQYKAGERVYSKFDSGSVDDDAKAWYAPLFSFRTSDKVYYLAISHSILSNVARHQAIRAFCIDHASLNDTIRLFKTDSTLSNTLDIGYNNRPFRGHTPFPPTLILFDSALQLIRVPVVDDDNNYVTDQYITYRWAGSYFAQE